MGPETDEDQANLAVTVPTKLTKSHKVADFDCGAPSLNEYLIELALKSQQNGNAVTYVSCRKNTKTVLGYYAVCTGGVFRDLLPGSARRNAPREVPVIVLGRMGVDRRAQGIGLGRSLLQHAIETALEAAQVVGARALIVTALDDEARAFYLKYGFTEFPGSPHQLMLSLKRRPTRKGR